MTPISKDDTISFFKAHQDQNPSAIVISRDLVMINVGGDYKKMSLSDITEAMKSGEIAGDSALGQALVVVESIQGMGLPPKIGSRICRSFISNMETLTPRKAAVQAFSEVVAAAKLGDDPDTQLRRIGRTLSTIAQDLVQGMSPDKVNTIVGKIETLLDERETALKDHDYEGASDAQEKLQELCGKYGINVGAPPREIDEDIARPIFEAGEASPRTHRERDLTKRFLKLQSGDNYELGTEAMLSLTAKAGLSLGVKTSETDKTAPTLSIASASVDVTAQGGIKGMFRLGRKSDTEWTVTYRTRVGGDVQGGARLNVMGTELGSKSIGVGGGDQVLRTVSFASPRDAAKFMTKILDEMVVGKTKVKGLPVEAPEGTKTPTPGHYVITEESPRYDQGQGGQVGQARQDQGFPEVDGPGQ